MLHSLFHCALVHNLEDNRLIACLIRNLCMQNIVVLCHCEVEGIMQIFRLASVFLQCYLTRYIDSMCDAMSQSVNRRDSSGGGGVDPSIVWSWGEVPLDSDLPASTTTSLD